MQGNILHNYGLVANHYGYKSNKIEVECNLFENDVEICRKSKGDVITIYNLHWQFSIIHETVKKTRKSTYNRCQNHVQDYNERSLHFALYPIKTTRL